MSFGTNFDPLNDALDYLIFEDVITEKDSDDLGDDSEDDEDNDANDDIVDHEIENGETMETDFTENYE